MAVYNKFQHFIEDLGKGVHHLDAGGDTLMAYLTDNAPDAVNNAVKADLAGITEENGYAAADIQNDFTQSDGTGTLTGVDVTWTASGGSFGPFRYVVIYNDTPTDPADPLVAYYDYGSEVTVNEGESFKLDFDASIFTIS